ncbi:MAG: tRNA pseudouridine(38-40) synthase TruA [Erysipelotrichales bacterium]|nr:tRNA pseudouridine(38-40) synthase TruA [Erysipelotrichales bacterium]
MRVRLDISYDGHNFMGFQRQPDLRTVQGEIEKVLTQIFDIETVVTAAGRTDAGVHALNQVVTFTPSKEIELNRLRYSLNCLLPNDIHVNVIQEVNDDFHPRQSAESKIYRYLINMGEANPFYENYRYELKRKLDVEKMIEASKLFIGTHDFKNFTTKKEDLKNFIRTIYDLKISQKENELCVEITGDGFMRYMVRMIVGTLIMVGLNKENKEFITERLNSVEHNVVIYKAPSNGLYLVKVNYKEDK